jgi:hypothetical protein
MQELRYGFSPKIGLSIWRGELADCTFADASKYFKRREGECATWSKTGTTYNIYTKATAS